MASELMTICAPASASLDTMTNRSGPKSQSDTLSTSPEWATTSVDFDSAVLEAFHKVASFRRGS